MAELLSLSLALIVVLIIGINAYRDWAALGRHNQQLEERRRTIAATITLLSLLKDAETGQRGFLLTGREDYLDPYRRALSEIPRTLERLGSLAADGPDQASRVEALKPLIGEKLGELRSTIDLRRQKGLEPALREVESDRGKNVMDRIRHVGAQMIIVANGQIRRQFELAEVHANRMRIASTGGAAVLFVLLILATITIQRGTHRRQKLIAALQDSEEQTRLIVDTAMDAVISSDGNGIISAWNPQAEATFGWTRQEAVGHSLQEIVLPPRDRDADVLGIQAYLANGEAAALRRRIEMTVLHRDGREFPGEIAITPILLGDRLFFSAFMRDITERKQAEQKLQAQLARLDLLSRTTTAMGERQDLRSIFQVVIRSLEDHLPIDFGCVCLYNAARESLSVAGVGIKSQELGLKLALTEESEIAIDRNGLSRCVRGELVYDPDVSCLDFPFPRRLASGGLRSFVAAPLRFESKVFGILVAARRQASGFSSGECEFLRQLSEHVALAAHQAEMYSVLQRAYDDLHQAQQAMMQQERLRALGQMASGIAHDINNALAPVALYTESLLDREPDLSPRTRQYLEITQRALDDVAHTVGRMQEFYRERAPQSALAPVYINPLVQHVVDLTRARWSDMPQQRGISIQLRLDLAPDLPAVLGIESEIREALVNLILNAVDAMPDGGILSLRTRVSRTEPAPARAHCVHAEVEDNGVGMDEETRRRCLEPFFTTKGKRGTGLGLAMVFGIMRRHHAEIEIESAPGKGTLVRLSLPVAPATLETPLPAHTYRAPSRLRILVIDDDPLIVNSLREILEVDGHTVIAADRGEQGIGVFQAAQEGEEFDIVITDLGMPGLDGRRVAGAVKAACPSTPVILLTGWGQRLASTGEIPPHVDRVLNKPPKLRELRTALAELANSHPL